MSVINNSINLHLITNANDHSDQYLQFINNCVAAGVTHIQLRQKNWHFNDLLAFGLDLKNILAQYNVPLIVNDNLKLAIALDATGIHLGQSDTSVAQARESLGPNKIIGLSIESHEELLIANQSNAINYVAASAVFPSKTKHNLKKIWGLTGLKQFCELSKHPVVAIGGIDKTNSAQVIDTGVAGIAIISAIHDAYNPVEYIQQVLTSSGTQNATL